MSNTAHQGVSAREASSHNYGRPCVGSCINHVAVVLRCVWQACSEEILGSEDKHRSAKRWQTFQDFNFKCFLWSSSSVHVNLLLTFAANSLWSPCWKPFCLSENSERLNITAVCRWCPPSFMVFNTKNKEEWWQHILNVLCQNGPGPNCGCVSLPPQKSTKPQTELSRILWIYIFPNPLNHWSLQFTLVLENI